jgi:hypothetical protein
MALRIQIVYDRALVKDWKYKITIAGCRCPELASIRGDAACAFRVRFRAPNTLTVVLLDVLPDVKAALAPSAFRT